ncbi:MAG: hypothetical protein D6795_13090, partial [Deltaproteobacteria bacterium]
ANLYMAFVLERLTLQGIMGFDLLTLLAPEQVVDLGNIVAPLPGNIAIPEGQQIRAIGDIPGTDYNVPIYHTPRVTDMSVVTGDVPLADAILLANESGGNFGEFVSGLFDILIPDQAGVLSDINVNADLSGQDIALSNPIDASVSVTVGNHPSGLGAIAFSVRYDMSGDTYYPTGFASVPQNGGNVTVPATGDGGPFAGMPLGIVVAASDITNFTFQSSVIFQRNVSGAVTADSFLAPPSGLDITGRTYTFTGGANPGVSPDPDLNVSEITLAQRVAIPGSDQQVVRYPLIWKQVMPGDQTSFTLPKLPTSDEVGRTMPELPSAENYFWFVTAYALTDGDPFDFDHYVFSSFNMRVTHGARRGRNLLEAPA